MQCDLWSDESNLSSEDDFIDVPDFDNSCLHGATEIELNNKKPKPSTSNSVDTLDNNHDSSIDSEVSKSVVSAHHYVLAPLT